MWARALYAIRRRVPDPVGLLASWQLSVVLTVTAALYFAFLAIWSTSSPPHVVGGIAKLIPFWLVYGLLIINTALCLWRRLARLEFQLSKSPVFAQHPPRFALELPDDSGEPSVRLRMRELGFKRLKNDDQSLVGISGRWSALGPFLFHGAFFLIALAVGLTMLFRQETTYRVAEGEIFVNGPDQVASRPGRSLVNLPFNPPEFTVGTIRPEFWGDQLLFTRLQAEVVFEGGDHRVTQINRPLWVGPSTFLRLSGFGYTPRYEVRDAQGRVLESLFVKLAVFPPGSRDGFRLESFPHQVDIEVLPDAVEDNGAWVTRSLNLVNPVVSVRVSRGKLILAQTDVESGGRVTFEGLQLAFPEIRYWGEFSLVRDPGVPVLFAAFFIALVGLAMKLGRGRAEIQWVPGPDEKGGRILCWGDVKAPRGSSGDEGGLSF